MALQKEEGEEEEEGRKEGNKPLLALFLFSFSCYVEQKASFVPLFFLLLVSLTLTMVVPRSSIESSLNVSKKTNWPILRPIRNSNLKKKKTRTSHRKENRSQKKRNSKVPVKRTDAASRRSSTPFKMHFVSKLSLARKRYENFERFPSFLFFRSSNFFVGLFFSEKILSFPLCNFYSSSFCLVFFSIGLFGEYITYHIKCIKMKLKFMG